MSEQLTHLYPARKSRLVPVRFERARVGTPSDTHPYLDDRGFAQGDVHAEIVGMIPRADEADTSNDILVRLVRQNIAPTARLFLKSSDEAIFQIVEPTGELTGTEHHDIKLRGIRGGQRNPEKALLEVRYGSVTGPIIHELGVWVFTPLRVNLSVHFVKIHNAAGTGDTAVNLDLAAAVRYANHIWKPAGIRLRLPAQANWQNWSIELSQADRLSTSPVFGAEVDKLVDQNWVANTVNLYCIKQIDTGSTLGIGVSRNAISDPSDIYYPACNMISNPCIVLGEVAANGDDIIRVGATIAHEIGHFFKLAHPSEPPNTKTDIWSYRTLMFNYSFVNSPPFNLNTGYLGGRQRRGCMITLKNLSQAATRQSNRHGLIARSTINSGQQY